MKITKFTDESGYQRVVASREGDDLSCGIPLDPPNLDRLDWEALQRDLHNALSNRGLVTWHDVQVAAKGDLITAITATFKKPLIALYRNEET